MVSILGGNLEIKISLSGLKKPDFTIVSSILNITRSK